MRSGFFPFLLASSLAAWGVENMLPAPAPASRYDKSLEHSPFALATKAEAPPEAKESFCANWVLTGLSRLPDDEGVPRDFVSIRSRDQKLSFSLFGGEESKDKDSDVAGVTLVRVDRMPDLRKSTVTLKKGNETGKIEFSPEAAPPPGVAVAPNQPGLGRPGVPNSVVPHSPLPPNRGGVVPNVGGVRPQLPRPNSGPGPANPGIVPGGNAGAPGASVRALQQPRTRVIQSHP